MKDDGVQEKVSRPENALDGAGEDIVAEDRSRKSLVVGALSALAVVLVAGLVAYLLAGVGDVSNGIYVNGEDVDLSANKISEEIGEVEGRLLLTGSVFDENGRFGSRKSRISLLDAATGETEDILDSQFKYVGYFGGNLVVQNHESEKYFRYDFAGSNLISLAIPDFTDEETKQITLIRTPLDGGSKVLVDVYPYKDESEIDAYFGLPLANHQEYVYSFEDNLAVRTSEVSWLVEARDLLGKEVEYIEGYSLKFFDENVQVAVFQYSAEGIGCSDIAFVNLKSKTVDLKRDDSSIGCLYVDDARGLGLYTQEDNGVTANLVDLSQGLTPIRSMQVREPTRGGGYKSPISTVAWQDDAEKVFVMMYDEVFLLDFGAETVQSVYSDNTIGAHSLTLDRTHIVSDGNGIVVVTDYYDSEYVPCVGNGLPNCPSGDYQDRFVVSNTNDGSKQIFLEGEEMILPIAWIE